MWYFIFYISNAAIKPFSFVYFALPFNQLDNGNQTTPKTSLKDFPS